MDAWTFIWLLLILKIPVAALLLLVRWAVKQVPEGEASGEDGGIGPRPRPLHPHHPRSLRPRLPRRGPHGEPTLPAPARVRTATACSPAGRRARRVPRMGYRSPADTSR